MSRDPNQIDYSKLNHTLWSKRKQISEDTSKRIGEIFLKSNSFDKMWASNKEKKLDRFTSSLEGATEWVKTRFALTVNYLTEKGLIKSEKIKSLKLKNLEDFNKTSNEKLENIINDLKSWLSDTDRRDVDQHVSEWLIDLAEESESANELWKKVKELDIQNQDLQNELDAADTANEIVESAILSKWSLNNNIRKAFALKKINEDNSLSAEQKAREVLWQANKYVIWWRKKRKRYFGSLEKMNVNRAYFRAANSIRESIKKASTREKVALRMILKQVDAAYESYIKATTIDKDTRKQYMRDVNNSMASAA